MAGSCGRLEIAHDALDGLEVEAGMLEVEEHEVASGGLQDMADARRGEFDDEMPELRRLRLRHGFERARPPSLVPPWFPLGLVVRCCLVKSASRRALADERADAH